MRIMGGFKSSLFGSMLLCCHLINWQFGTESHGWGRSITGVHVNSVIPKRLKRRGRRPIVIYVSRSVTPSPHDW